MCDDIIKMGDYHFILSYFERMRPFDFDNQLFVLILLDCRGLKCTSQTGERCITLVL